jgi:hypothetical protein
MTVYTETLHFIICLLMCCLVKSVIFQHNYLLMNASDCNLSVSGRVLASSSPQEAFVCWFAFDPNIKVSTMFRFSKPSASAVPISHNRSTSDPPPLPAFRGRPTAGDSDGDVDQKPKKASDATNGLLSSAADAARQPARDSAASGGVTSNNVPPAKVGLLAQIQHAVRFASGRYRRQRRAAGAAVEQQHEQSMKVTASSSLDRAALKNRIQKTLTEDCGDVTQNVWNLRDDVIRSRTNDYYTVTEGVRGVVVEVRASADGDSAAVKMSETDSETLASSSSRHFSSAPEGGTRSLSRDPSPMASSGYASDGLYTYLRSDLTKNAVTAGAETASDGGERGSEEWQRPIPHRPETVAAAGDNRAAAATVPRKSPTRTQRTNSRHAACANVGADVVSFRSSCLGSREQERHNAMTTSAHDGADVGRRSSSGTFSISSNGPGAKYGDSMASAAAAARNRKKPVYENLFNQACGMKMEASDSNNNNRRYSLQPGLLQCAVPTDELRRLSMGPLQQSDFTADDLSRLLKSDSTNEGKVTGEFRLDE